MNFQLVKYELSCGLASQLPESTLPEIVFAGRSNVGKSSLINKIFNQKQLARVSATPGKTATINFFRCGDIARFADLPGYGYASRGKESREQLKVIIESYILRREQMTNLFVLVDSRHKPQKIDLEFMQWLGENGVPFSIVFTKLDKLGLNVGKANIGTYKQVLLEQWEELPPIFVTSSVDGRGREDLLAYIEELNKL